MIKYNIRPAEPDDLAYIVSTWAKQIRSCAFGRLPLVEKDRLIARLLASSECYVAASTLDDSLLLGWIVCAETANGALIIHYCYLKADFRQFGIAKALLERAGFGPGRKTYASFQSPLSRRFCAARGIDYNPYLALGD